MNGTCSRPPPSTLLGGALLTFTQSQPYTYVCILQDLIFEVNSKRKIKHSKFFALGIFFFKDSSVLAMCTNSKRICVSAVFCFPITGKGRIQMPRPYLSTGGRGKAAPLRWQHHPEKKEGGRATLKERGGDRWWGGGATEGKDRRKCGVRGRSCGGGSGEEAG